MRVVPSALAYIMYQRGLRHLPAWTASILMLVEPRTAAVLAWALFAEALSPMRIADGALLLVSIVVTDAAATDALIVVKRLDRDCRSVPWRSSIWSMAVGASPRRSQLGPGRPASGQHADATAEPQLSHG